MPGTYRRSPERGFRKFAMAFWDRPRTGLIYGGVLIELTKAQRFLADVEAKHGVRPSMGQLVGRSVARALTEVPEANAKIIWGQAYLKDTVDVYFQVDIDGGKDLSGVVVYDTGRKSVLEVTEEMRARAKKLRGGEDVQYEKTQKGCLGVLPSWLLRPLLGFFTFLEYNLGVAPTFLGARPEPFGTVMLTNVSKFGVDFAYAPLVPVSRVPMVVLMGQVADRPWVADGEVVVRQTIPVSATFDHRIMDGNRIGRLIRAVQAYMANPYLYEDLGLPDPDAGVDAAEVTAPRGAEVAAADPGRAMPAPEAEHDVAERNGVEVREDGPTGR